MTAPQNEEPSDAELIARILEGDDGAFEQLACHHKPRVFQIASRYARNEHELADLAQEIFVKAYFALKSFRGDAPFEHWLSRIAVRACYDHLRSRQRKRETTLSELTDDQAAWLERAGMEQSTEQRDAMASAEEAKELLNWVLERLSPPDRMVITLLELEDKSVREVAGLMGWSQTLVKVRAFRARKAMRKIIEALQASEINETR
ncbi:MAG: sigma-70 family RNA polymerase sigma factor [Verrucomicrobiae bacterium]|nr:sigma-70 family RNA polymerase sigma factor [Verrucomicrobiae bacterium]